MKNSKFVLTGLLLGACILTGILLVLAPSSSPQNQISAVNEIDQIIEKSIINSNLKENQLRSINVEIDSSFTRKIYRIEVPPSFSKTSFHLELHHKLYLYNISAPAKMTFPDENMDIHVLINNTVFRTIRLLTKNVTESSG